MKLRFFKYWNRVRSSFWFVPTIMAGAAVALVFAGVAADDPVTAWLERHLGWTFTSEAQAASAVLRVIAGSMITIAGVVFSMTLVALSLASSQLGPRLLRNFMRDTSTQVVLGTFIATFVYCLLVLRTIRHEEDIAFVPNLSVSLGVALAVASVGVFIYFIHHVSVSIQANEIAARIGKELIERIEDPFPEDLSKNGARLTTVPPGEEFIRAFELEAQAVAANEDGYLQSIDGNDLLALAEEEDLVVRLERKPGDYIYAGRPLVLIAPGNRVTDQLTRRVQALFVTGNQRASDQDIEFAVDQLVEMAVRALSPGVNDPFTAVACVDHLGSALCRLAARESPSPYCHDHRNQLRLIVRTVAFPEVADAAFNQIRQSCRSNAAVTIRLLETIAVIAEFAHRRKDRDALMGHAEMIARGANEALPEAEDRRAVEERWQATSRALTGSGNS